MKGLKVILLGVAEKFIRSRNVRTCTKPFHFIISLIFLLCFRFFIHYFFLCVLKFQQQFKPKNMLKSYEQGYSVMSKDLSGYSLESTDLEACKRHCQNGEVVVRRIPYTCGFSIRVMWYEFWKPFGFKYAPYNKAVKN